MICSFLILCLLHTVGVFCAQCYQPVPAFPMPDWSKSTLRFDETALKSLQSRLDTLLSSKQYDTASTSVEVTSTTNTLWSYYHSARKVNETRPGDHNIDGDSQYRIASITKAYTTLAILQLHSAGKLNIHDPINKYISELAEKDSGKIPWKDITIRAMASQLSGIPREFGQSDFLSEYSKPWELGFPPASINTIPHCFRNSSIICSTDEILEYVKTYEPLFAPNQQSTYSNLNFELLGIVIERVSGQKYEEYVFENILKPLKMSSSTLKKPSEEHAVIPDGENYFDVDEGALNPTGGIYSSSADQSKFLRYVLTHYNALVTGINWFQPASYGGSMNSAYGMPWEIFRTNQILPSKRPVTFVTKSGGLPGYYSQIAALPEYNLGIVVLVGGPPDLLDELIELVHVEIVRAAEVAIWRSISDEYTGKFVASHLNSSVKISTSADKGIVLESFVSNSTNVMTFLAPGILRPGIGKRSWHIQLIPTLLYKNESSQQGEIFRFVFVPERSTAEPTKVFDTFCVTDIDTPGTYAGLPSNEIVYWHERSELELPAWRVKLRSEHQHVDFFNDQLLLQKADD